MCERVKNAANVTLLFNAVAIGARWGMVGVWLPFLRWPVVIRLFGQVLRASPE